MSKSTPIGVIAKFAAAGKAQRKKDLGLMAMTYGTAYVAQVSWGARDVHTIQASLEAEAYPGTPLGLGHANGLGPAYRLDSGRAPTVRRRSPPAGLPAEPCAAPSRTLSSAQGSSRAARAWRSRLSLGAPRSRSARDLWPKPRRSAGLSSRCAPSSRMACSSPPTSIE